MTNTVVILANSIKHGKHCVAGKCVDTNKWIRPVSDMSGKELDDEQSSYSNKYGTFVVKPMQKIQMSLESHAPLVNQPDNYVVSKTKWCQRYKIESYELEKYLDYPETLWGNGSKVSYQAVLDGTFNIKQSLYLVKVENLKLYVNEYNKRRASFNYNNIRYELPVTDPMFDNIVSSNKQLSGILCISLGECFNDNCYKIVATIF